MLIAKVSARRVLEPQVESAKIVVFGELARPAGRRSAPLDNVPSQSQNIADQ
jgi:hypothetical protein